MKFEDISENTSHTRKTTIFANRTWLKPFRAIGFMGVDSQRKQICDANTQEIAKAIAELLNKKAEE
jgi:hypothetical protein